MTMADSNPLGDKDFVETLIPQKKPFVMVDTLYCYSENELVAGFTIHNDAVFLKDNSFVE